MGNSFRSELFNLCKLIQNNDDAQQIRALLLEMSSPAEISESGSIVKNAHGDFASVARHGKSEFHSYLFLDDSIESIALPEFYTVGHLNKAERVVLENGHKTLTRFVDLCLSDIATRSNSVSSLINPYSYYKPVSLSPDSSSILNENDYRPVVNAFKDGAVYKALMAANFTALFDRFSDNDLRYLIRRIENEVNHSLGEDIDKELEDFALKIETHSKDMPRALLAFIVLIYALKTSLALACRLLFKAICGVDLFVLNNDNIISIEKNTTTLLCHFFKVFAQDMAIDCFGNLAGNLLLIDCDPPHGPHIHEFGMAVSLTYEFAGEFGQSAKYSFVTVNEEMIYIHNLTNSILKLGLPEVKTQTYDPSSPQRPTD